MLLEISFLSKAKITRFEKMSFDLTGEMAIVWWPGVAMTKNPLSSQVSCKFMFNLLFRLYILCFFYCHFIFFTKIF